MLHDPVKNTAMMQAVDTLEQGLSKIKDENEGHIEKEPQQEDDYDEELSHREETVEVQPMSEPGVYCTRSGRAVKPPERYGFEKALAVIEEVYNESFSIWKAVSKIKSLKMWDDESNAVSTCCVSKA